MEGMGTVLCGAAENIAGGNNHCNTRKKFFILMRLELDS